MLVSLTQYGLSFFFDKLSPLLFLDTLYHLPTLIFVFEISSLFFYLASRAEQSAWLVQQPLAIVFLMGEKFVN